jgi:hypothetical protein
MIKLKIDWKELLFPVLEDIRIINIETDTTRVSSNNWALAENNTVYKEVLSKIKENQSKDDTQHNIVILR